VLCVDGVILVDPEYVGERKVFAQVLAAFRYGREDLDVLGLTFRKDLYISSQQVYPPLSPSYTLFILLYCYLAREVCLSVDSRAPLSSKRPLLSVSVSVCLFVCLFVCVSCEAIFSRGLTTQQ